jgi:hypothetical protein
MWHHKGMMDFYAMIKCKAVLHFCFEKMIAMIEDVLLYLQLNATYLTCRIVKTTTLLVSNINTTHQ